jgi:iron complex transport system substrate-binding protein
MHRTLLARRPLAAAVLALVLLAGAACSGSSNADDDATAWGAAPGPGLDSTTLPEGPWSFTDDFGETIELDEAPDVVVAEVSMAGALWDFGIQVDATFGQRELPDGTTDPMGLADPDAMESLGDVYGEVNVEQLRLMEPDVIVTGSFEEGIYWGIEDDLVSQVQDTAPIIALQAGGRPLDETAGRVGDLAEALGADLDGPQVTEARESYDTAAADLTAALEAKPGLTFVAMSGTPDQLYVAVPSGYTDLTTYQELGMDIVEPDTDEEYWETLSWEQADTYPADVILADSRGGSVDQILEVIPEGVQDMAPISAGQLARWEVMLAPGWANLARVLTDLTEVVEGADPNIV